MRKIIISACLIFCYGLISAQHTINFHIENSTENYELNESDSIWFNDDQTVLYYSNLGIVYEYNVADLDSMSFTTSESYNVYIYYDGSQVQVINPLSESGVSISKTGAYVTITSTSDIKDINYICEGTTSAGNLKIYSDSRFNLLLNNANITNPIGPAINIQSEKKGTIHVVAGSSNTLTDGTSYDDPAIVNDEEEDQKAALFSEGKLYFIGSGELTINSYGDDQHAIASDEEIEIAESNLIIASSVKDGIHASEGFYMDGGVLTIYGSGDGIDSDEGITEINCGTIIIYSTADDVKAIKSDSIIIINGGYIELNVNGDQSKGIKSKQDIYLNGGVLTGTAGGDVVLEPAGSGYDPSYCSFISSDANLYYNGTELDISTSGKGSRGLSVDGNLEIQSGTIDITSSGSGTTYTNSDGIKDAYHGSCVNVDGNIYIQGGELLLYNSGTGGKGISCDSDIIIGGSTSEPEISVTTTGSSITISLPSGRDDSGESDESKAIKADNNFTMNSGGLTISSADDGIKAENKVTINNGTINITKAGEGIEAEYIEVNDGSIHIIASDDGFNATTGNGGESNDGSLLQINGGYSYITSSGGDPLDSNGSFTVTGGTTIVVGPQSNVEVGMDVNGSKLISDGFIIISGVKNNMTESFSSSSTQYSISFSSNSTIAANTLVHLEDSNGNTMFSFKPTKSFSSLVFSSPDLKNGTTYKLYTGGSSTGTETDGLYEGGSYTAGTLKKTFTLTDKVTSVSF